MKKWVIPTILVFVTIGLGLAAAWGTSSVMQKRISTVSQAPFFQQPSYPERDSSGRGKAWGGAGSMMGGYHGQAGGWNMPGGMMGGFSGNNGGYGRGLWNNNRGSQYSGERISIEQAVTGVEAYLKGYYAENSSGPEVKEVMEFNNNFYIAVVEENSEKGAFEVLVDPYSGSVFPEPGPNMMWNLKYGHMRWRQTADDNKNTISLEEAQALAQKAVLNTDSTAEIEGTGTEFYGYYTFDYAVNGQVAGMLSVNGFSGDVWFHNWHGKFISEKEIE